MKLLVLPLAFVLLAPLVRADHERGWTEGDVRDDLRRSEEYRRKHGRR